MYSITDELQIFYIAQSREKQTCDLQQESPAFPFPQLPKFILKCSLPGGGGGGGIEIRDTNLNQLSSVHYLYSWHNVQLRNYCDK